MPATTPVYTKVNISRQPPLLKTNPRVVEGVVDAFCFDQMFALLQMSNGTRLPGAKRHAGQLLAMASISLSEGRVSVFQ